MLLQLQRMLENLRAGSRASRASSRARAGATPAETMVAMKPVAEGMGLAWQGQHEKLKGHPVLSQGIKEILMPSAGGVQAMTALPDGTKS